MSKYCKKHKAMVHESSCLNCTYGKYINNTIKKGHKGWIKPEVLANHQIRLI